MTHLLAQQMAPFPQFAAPSEETIEFLSVIMFVFMLGYALFGGRKKK